MSYPSDFFPDGPDPAAPLRELILDGLAGIITEFLLETLGCAGCDRAYPCPDHQDGAAIAEDCRAVYLQVAAMGVNG